MAPFSVVSRFLIKSWPGCVCWVMKRGRNRETHRWSLALVLNLRLVEILDDFKFDSLDGIFLLMRQIFAESWLFLRKNTNCYRECSCHLAKGFKYLYLFLLWFYTDCTFTFLLSHYLWGKINYSTMFSSRRGLQCHVKLNILLRLWIHQDLLTPPFVANIFLLNHDERKNVLEIKIRPSSQVYSV